MSIQNRYIKAVASGGGSSEKIYNRPIQTGQVTVYQTYDDAWCIINRPDPYVPPTSGIPTKLVNLKIWRLVLNNNFGNTFRFTGINGAYWDPETQLYYVADGTSTTTFALAFPNYYVIDNYTGLAYIALFNSTNVNLTTAISECEALTTAGFTDWFLPNINMLISVADLSYIYPLGNSTFPSANVPFNNTSNGNKWSSTTYKNIETRAYLFTPNGTTTVLDKGGIARYIPVRYHFV